MKILMVSAGLRPQRQGGVPAYVEELGEALRARGHETVYLDTSRTRPLSPARLVGDGTDAAGFRRYSLMNSGMALPWVWHTSPRRQVRSTRRVREMVARLIRAEQPDVVHLHELLCLPADLLTHLKSLGCKVVFTSQDYYPVCPTIKLWRWDDRHCDLPTERLICKTCCAREPYHWQLRVHTLLRRWLPASGGVPMRLRRALTALADRAAALSRRFLSTDAAYRRRREAFVAHLRNVDLILCMSRLHEGILRGIAGGDAPLRQMYLSRQSLRFSPVPPAPGRRQPGEMLAFVALNVSGAAKGLDVLRAAFGGLESRGVPFRLTVYGASGQDSACIRYVTHYREEDLDGIVAGADFGVVPSRWREAYGYVGAEMLSRGLPLLVSARGAMPEYVRDGEDGLVFEPDPPAALAGIVERLIGDDALQRRLWQGAATARPFQPFARHVEDVERVYAELCS